jgi:hypothetical protein
LFYSLDGLWRGVVNKCQIFFGSSANCWCYLAKLEKKPCFELFVKHNLLALYHEIVRCECVYVCLCLYFYFFQFSHWWASWEKLSIKCFQKNVQTVEDYTLNNVFSKSWLKKQMKNLLYNILIWFFCHQNSKIHYKKNNIVHNMSEISNKNWTNSHA